jgi:hypothetical protein
VIDCEQCERPFEPVTFRWLCPYCKWKADCCTGEPLPDAGLASSAPKRGSEGLTGSRDTT